MKGNEEKVRTWINLRYEVFIMVCRGGVTVGTLEQMSQLTVLDFSILLSIVTYIK